MKNTMSALAVMAIALLPVGESQGKNDATRQDRAEGSNRRGTRASKMQREIFGSTLGRMRF
jgi:hypothetical protein